MMFEYHFLVTIVFKHGKCSKNNKQLKKIII